MKKTKILIAGIIAVIVFIIIVVNYNKTKIGKEILPEKILNNNEMEFKNDKETVSTQETNTIVSNLKFDQSSIKKNINEKFSIDAMIDPRGKKISAVELHIIFNSKILKLESIDSLEIFPVVLSSEKIDNEKGIASIVVAVPIDKVSPVDISSIARFNFNAINNGVSEVVFSNESVAAAEGDAGNVIATREKSNIVIE